MVFGALLRNRREASRKSLREFARCLGLSPSYVSMVELGKLPPFGADHIRAAAVFIGADPIELLQAAMADRNSVELDASVSQAHRTASTALAMHWHALTIQQLETIAAIVNGDAR